MVPLRKEKTHTRESCMRIALKLERSACRPGSAKALAAQDTEGRKALPGLLRGGRSPTDTLIFGF